MSNVTQRSSYRFTDYHPEPDDFYAEVTEGLKNVPPTIPPKFFYDELGSQLFDQICKTEQYYPTRTETAIIRENIDEIGQYLGTGCLLVEPGSGNSRKVRELLDAIQPHTYLPMDISKSYLQAEAKKLDAEYPWLNVHAICTDYTSPIDLPTHAHNLHRIAFFPGSSIGNFEPEDAIIFLQNIARMVSKNGGLLIGVDLKKDKQRLSAAYNDEKNYTSRFNLNLLTRINRDLQGDFNLDNFEHKAFYNQEKGRVEMHLVSTTDQRVTIGDESFHFATGENIHTENSYKYTVEEFQRLVSRAGFVPEKVWTDDEQLFSLHYFRLAE